MNKLSPSAPARKQGRLAGAVSGDLIVVSQAPGTAPSAVEDATALVTVVGPVV